MKFKINGAKSKEAVKGYIDKLKDDKTYNVDIALRREQRSISQNRLYWMWVGIMADETGNSKDVIHTYCSKEFLGVNSGVINGKHIETLISTTTLNTERFTKFLEQVEIFANTELSIILPHPDDALFEDIARSYL